MEATHSFVTFMLFAIPVLLAVIVFELLMLDKRVEEARQRGRRAAKVA